MTKQKIRARNLDLVEIRPRQVNFDPIKQALPKVAKRDPRQILVYQIAGIALARWIDPLFQEIKIM